MSSSGQGYHVHNQNPCGSTTGDYVVFMAFTIFFYVHEFY
jgi:hypothetical protein